MKFQFGFITAALLERNFSIARALSNNEYRPNIMIIVADDVGTGDIPIYWNTSIVDMPNIQRLADMGVKFMDAHSTPTCSASRYILNSGNYQNRAKDPSGLWGYMDSGNNFRRGQKSIAEVLSRDGYSTCMSGKWHLGSQIPFKPNATIDKSESRIFPLSHESHDWTQPLIGGPQEIGFNSSYITIRGVQAAPYSFFRDGFLTTNVSDAFFWDKGDFPMPGGKSTIKNPGEGSPEWDTTVYNMILVNETERFIDSHMASHRSEHPWFVYAALGSVHTPHAPPDNYLDGTPIAGSQETPHMDVLYEMDKVVGSLVTLVEERDLASDTIFIFTSDNGGIKTEVTNAMDFGHNSQGPFRGSKGEIYEGGHRVPLIFRADGIIPVNETRSHMVGLNDIYKTLCDSLGIPVPNAKSAMDSVNFGNYLISERNVQGLRKKIQNWDYKGGKLQAKSVRFKFMKFIQFYDEEEEEAETELYDLETDLSEEMNLINETVYSELIEKMKKMMED